VGRHVPLLWHIILIPGQPVFADRAPVRSNSYCASSLKQQSAGRHVAPLWHIPNSKPTILCSYSLMLHVSWKSSKYQFLIFSLTWLALDPSIYYTLGKYANHYTTDAVLNNNKKYYCIYICISSWMQRFFIDVLSFILFPTKIVCPLQVIFLFSSLNILWEFTIMKIQHRQHKRYSECTFIICCYLIRLYLSFY
jgi:hypothetical protein